MEHIFWVCSYQSKWSTYSECALISQNGALILSAFISQNGAHILTALIRQNGALILSVLYQKKWTTYSECTLSDKMGRLFWVCFYQSKWSTYSKCALINQMEHLFWVCSCQIKLEHIFLEPFWFQRNEIWITLASLCQPAIGNKTIYLFWFQYVIYPKEYW